VFFTVAEHRAKVRLSLFATRYGKGSQPFSDHVPLQHSDRWPCTPSAVRQMNMCP